MWFTLPLEVRLDIYRRSRFLNARERVEKKLAARPIRPVLQKIKDKWSIYIVSFRITNEKLLNIEYYICSLGDQDYDFTVVETFDYSQIIVFLHLNKKKDRLILNIGTEKSVRTGVRRNYDRIFRFNSFTSTHTEWYQFIPCEV
jgi:hypothetical protein